MKSLSTGTVAHGLFSGRKQKKYQPDFYRILFLNSFTFYPCPSQWRGSWIKHCRVLETRLDGRERTSYKHLQTTSFSFIKRFCFIHPALVDWQVASEGEMPFDVSIGACRLSRTVLWYQQQHIIPSQTSNQSIFVPSWPLIDEMNVPWWNIDSDTMLIYCQANL